MEEMNEVQEFNYYYEKLLKTLQYPIGNIIMVMYEGDKSELRPWLTTWTKRGDYSEDLFELEINGNLVIFAFNCKNFCSLVSTNNKGLFKLISEGHFNLSNQPKREIIRLSPHVSGPLVDDCAFEDEDYSIYFNEDGDPNGHELWKFWDDFEFISEEVTYYDLEKGYEDTDTVIKRISDGKYFKGSWMHSYYLDDEYPDEFEEVFPKEKTITIYE